MRSRFYISIFFLVTTLYQPIFAQSGTADTIDVAVRLARSNADLRTYNLPDLIISRLDTLMRRQSPIIGIDDQIHNLQQLKRFYAMRGYKPVWLLGRYVPPKSIDFVQCIAGAEWNGLMPDDYHFSEVKRIADKSATEASETMPIGELIDFELLMSDAYMVMGTHYLLGKVQPDSLGIDWHIKGRTPVDMPSYFIDALHNETEEKDLCYSLSLLLPLHPEYAKLQTLLQVYKKLHWSPIFENSSILLQKGSSDPVIGMVKQRLKTTDEIQTADASSYFDRDLEWALANFQQRRGLPEDGMVRWQTLKALNEQPDSLIKKVKATMERWRWMPEDLGPEYFMVNIPGFDIRRYSSGELLMKEKVIVGLKTNPTPCFLDTMAYMIFNPYWNIPKSIAKAELAPQVLADNSYFELSDIKVFKDNKEVDPKKVDWKTADFTNYNFQHGVNDYNPMGVVKFMFPNPYDIYLHDTNERDLFNNSRRSFSHGCVRVKDPLVLAASLLEHQANWDTTKLNQIVKSQKQLKLDLTSPQPIYLVYNTVFFDESDKANFREDLYGWDEKLLQKLSNPLRKTADPNIYRK